MKNTEILRLARAFSLAPHIVEKDYALGWLLEGISAIPEISENWVFKGGTCLKKCHLETYRFSEDLDFTVADGAQLDADLLRQSFEKLADWVNQEGKIQILGERTRIRLTEFEAGRFVEARVYYRGPLQQQSSPPKIKFDLSNMEKLVHPPVRAAVHHMYGDFPAEGVHVLSYRSDEVFAEKTRAMSERERPRDLYDFVHMYRNGGGLFDREAVLDTLREKCAFKGAEFPTIEKLRREDLRKKLDIEWKDMLDRQLPALPAPDQFWDEIPAVMRWLHGEEERPVLPELAPDRPVDSSWQPPSMCSAWDRKSRLELVRFAAANRICVNLQHEGSGFLVEPYSLHRSTNGDLLLGAALHGTDETKTFPVGRIKDIALSETAFRPRFRMAMMPTRSAADVSPQQVRETPAAP